MSRLSLAASLFVAFATTTVRAADPPKVWAIVIGIDKYDDKGIAGCPGAEFDSRRVRNWLVQTAGWDGRQILEMGPNSRAGHGPVQEEITNLRPTRANLDWAIKEWLPARVRPGDVALIYFAGQMLGGKTGDTLSRDHLLPIDANASKPDETGWSLADDLDPLASKGENLILTWIDSSLSGRGKPAIALDGRRTDSSRFLGEMTRWPGTAAWLAADGALITDPPDSREPSAFVTGVLPAFGTPENPVNLLGGLFTSTRNPRLTAQNFRSAGALGPNLSLWPKLLAESAPLPSEFLLQRGHADRITSVVFSADGESIITASMDSTIKIWRASDGVLLRTLPAHMIGVTALAISPDGTSLASGDGAGRVILWSLSDFRTRRFAGPAPHERAIAKVEFVGDGQNFATIDLAGKAVLWTASPRGITPSELMTKATAMAAGGGRIAVATGSGREKGVPFVRVFNAKGGLIREVNGHSARVSPGAIAIDNNRLAIGDDTGDVRVWSGDLKNEPRRFKDAAPIESITIAGPNVIAAGGTSASILWEDPARPPVSVSMREKVARVESSPDGRSIVATTTGGDINGWTIQAPGKVETAAITNPPEAPRSTIASLAPNGRSLVSGDQDGGIRIWQWPTGEPVSSIKPGRGKIEALAVSKDGRNLIQIDHDRAARVWDLREGRGLRTIPGQWIGATFLPDGSSLAMTSKAGDVVLVDPSTTAKRRTVFDRPKNEKGEVTTWGFGPVAVSPDGKLILAGSREGPIASMWLLSGGTPTVTIRDHSEPISAVSFADDSKHWLTASTDGTAMIWAANAKAPVWTLALEPGNAEDADPAVTSASIAPGPLQLAATGHRDGRIVLWRLVEGKKPVPTVLGTFDGEVRSLAFSSDGTKLIAGGSDKVVRVHTIGKPGAPLTEPIRLQPQHTEQVNAVVAWPDGKLLASAGDDGSIRFWKPDGSGGIGTIATSSDDGTWVAFDPEGRFDSAPGGESRVTYMRGGKVLSLDQFDGNGRVYGLSTLWLEGKTADTISPYLAKLPAGLAIEPLNVASAKGEAELRVRLGDADASNLRLYQNDVPIREASDFTATADPNVKTVKVRLATGENRFAAMAAKSDPGAVFGRSNVLALRGPNPTEAPKGSVHTLALGISAYDSNALKYASDDAESMKSFLDSNGFSAGKDRGVTKLLRDREVGSKAVAAALREIREASRPEDTVVIFLAGHTDVRRDDRFCLLLDKFPFAPNALAEGERGPIRTAANVTETNLAPVILPYATLYSELARMNAKNRLVIIDACQAGAIFDDPAVKRIRRKVDDGAHQARTSYILAARKGEPATESSVLKHGLLTYLMLQGMGATDLAPAPGDPLGDADADRDGIVTTEELRQYLDVNLPILANRVAVEALRANPNPRTPNAIPAEDPSRNASATATFPVARIRKSPN